MLKNKKQLTTRCYNLEIRADENETGVIEGVPIVFDKETVIYDYCGQYREVIEKDALKNTDMKDVRLFVNHDIDKITLARSKNGKGTMSFEVKEDGVHMRATLDIENNTEAKNLYSAIKRGDMDGMSFMFRVDKDEWEYLDSDLPLRKIKSISIIHEVSVVNFPAYNQTSVSARSSEETDTSPLEEARKAQSEETEKRKSAEIDLLKLKYKYLMS